MYTEKSIYKGAVNMEEAGMQRELGRKIGALGHGTPEKLTSGESDV